MKDDFNSKPNQVSKTSCLVAKMLGHLGGEGSRVGGGGGGGRTGERVSTWSLSPSLSSLSISRNFCTHMERKLNYPQQIELGREASVCEYV